MWENQEDNNNSNNNNNNAGKDSTDILQHSIINLDDEVVNIKMIHWLFNGLYFCPPYYLYKRKCILRQARLSLAKFILSLTEK